MKLHLGSGMVTLEGWLNVDIATPTADLHLDLRKPLPFGDESIDYVFSEHFIEHITREEAIGLIKECHRVLNKNGVLRLSTPNLKHLVISYLTRNVDEWGEIWRPTNPCRLLNEGMRCWGHEYVYDEEDLFQLLSEAGFRNVRFVGWRESAIQDLAGLESRPFHNELIVEAMKSGSVNSYQAVVAEVDVSEPWLRDFHKGILSHCKRVEQTIADMATHIGHLEQTVSDMATHIGHIEADLKATRQHSKELEKVMTEFRLSWCGRLKSAFWKLHSSLTTKKIAS
jgi:predicted SAM-dependent methyltransferase